MQRPTFRVILRFLIYALLGPLALFLSAGTLRWGMGWLYAGLYVLTVVASRVIVASKHPDLLQERGQAIEAEDVPKWDRLLTAVAALYTPLATWIVSGLDHRWNWTEPLPAAVPWLAFAAVLCANGLASWALVANRFFSSQVRIQSEREHQVVKHGPYRFVRHPGYAGGMFSALVGPLVLGSLWGVIPGAVGAVALIWRTALEDQTLQEELPGYQEYAQETPYRLIPGLW